jgi:uncharacterized protein YneF (UPF0154 family)
MMEDAGAMKGIIFVILTIIIGIGIWVTNRRKERKLTFWPQISERVYRMLQRPRFPRRVP